MLGELLVAAEFSGRGVEVYRAIGPYDADLVVIAGGNKYSVQVKSTANESPKWQFRFRGMNNRYYARGALDWFAVVHLPTRRVALIPAEGKMTCTVDFDNLDPEWEFDTGVARMREGGTV